MKKSLVALTLLAGMTAMNANATLIHFNDSTFNGGSNGGAGVSFDKIDWSPDEATVVQKDTGDAQAFTSQYDLFSEWGQTVLADLYKGLTKVNASLPYEMFISYQLNGKVNFMNSALNVLFNGGSVDLMVDTDLAVGRQGASSTTVGSFSVGGGKCLIAPPDANEGLPATGSCNVKLNFTAVPGYFSVNGTDVSTFGPVNSYSNLIVTVQDIIGLNPVYVGGPNTSQQFKIVHDGNQTFRISEPTTVAVLGLGLLGLGVARRNKKPA